MTPGKLEGLIAAPHTPFDRCGEVDLRVIEKQAEQLAGSGVRGIYVSGTTGEGFSCSVAERKRVMEEWAKQAHKRLFLIVHVGALCIRDAQELAAYAQKVGADGTSVVSPCFFRPASIDALVAFSSAVASCAPDLPFYYYHTTMAGVSLPMPRFLEAAEGRIPNLAGIKFNNPDLCEFQNCLRACGGRFDVIWGVDEFLAGALALGARAAIGSTYNYAAPLFWKIWQDFERGDMESTRLGMAKACRIVDVLTRFGGVAAGKAMMAIHGIDVGDVRLPLVPLTAEQKGEVVAELKHILE